MAIFKHTKLLLLLSMKKFSYFVLALLVILLIVFLMGPKPDFKEVTPDLPDLNISIDEVQAYVSAIDNEVSDLKPGTRSKIIWNDTLLQNKTEYVVLYLHGFSATGEEGGDVHEAFAAHFGANLFVPRLYDSGRKSIDTYKNLTPSQMMDSAKEALALSQLLGEKIILMSCSTGGTYSAFLAAHHPEIHSLFMYSPNIDLDDQTSNAILYPWGVKILRSILGSDYNTIDHYNDEQKIYWNEKYHTDGIVALKYLLHQTMTKEVFEKIEQPTFVGVYYKDENEKDKVVSVDRINDFYDQIGTPNAQKRKFVCPDCMSHVISSRLMNDNVGLVLDESIEFAEEILGLMPIYTGVTEN